MGTDGYKRIYSFVQKNTEKKYELTTIVSQQTDFMLTYTTEILLKWQKVLVRPWLIIVNERTIGQ